MPTPDTPTDTLVRCVGLTKTFKDFWLRDRVRAVDGIDLEVRRGEVFGLLGPNGSGKSTTIKMILGLLHPTAGRIAVFGKPPRDTANKERIGYLPEESYLYRFLDARETLEYYGKLFHQDRGTRRRRIDMLLEMVGLDKVARRPIGEYSKGMQRRIGLAQALINDPELLILDEPTTGLDPIGTRQIKDLIRTLRDAGKTVVLCSHLLGDVEDVTDRCCIMFGGKVRRSGSIEALLSDEARTELITGPLDERQRAAAVTALEAVGADDVRVRPGRQRLEALFLDIVAQAQSEGATTSGAGNTGQVAAFLSDRGHAGHPEASEPADGEAASEASTNRVLAKLTVPAAGAASTMPEGGRAEHLEAPEATPSAAEEAVLAGLVTPGEPDAVPPSAPADPDPPPPASESVEGPGPAAPSAEPGSGPATRGSDKPAKPAEPQADRDVLEGLL